MTPEAFRALREGLSQLYWDKDFQYFCDLLQLPSDRYAEAKYQNFQACVQAMQGLSDADWATLITAIHQLTLVSIGGKQ